MKIEEIKKIVFNGIREFYAEKQEFENSHISDDEFIKKFKKIIIKIMKSKNITRQIYL